ncbi:MAG: hypothetical protein SR1Q7_11460 [Quinella sp. 1Q7]|nr:hypothetical protein [Quinella sp. 1Q7]
MKHFFSEIDEVTLTFSDIHINRYGMEYIRIYFERPNENGFDFLESTLPMLNVKASSGFTDAELSELLNYARINAFLIWEIAREDGNKIAVRAYCRFAHGQRRARHNHRRKNFLSARRDD